jgi:hypothetical protein
MIPAVYYVPDLSDGIVITPEIEGRRISWSGASGGRGFSFECDSIVKNPDQPIPKTIKIEIDNNEMTLELLTLEIFNRSVKSTVYQGHQLNFKNDAEVQNYYIKNRQNF